MIVLKLKGDFNKTRDYLKKVSEKVNDLDVDKYGREGVEALSSATPRNTGLTASSWTYEIKKTNGKTEIIFHNSNIQNGVPIAIILQYGHATRTGGYVQGRDYINPAIRPVFDKIVEEACREVSKL